MASDRLSRTNRALAAVLALLVALTIGAVVLLVGDQGDQGDQGDRGAAAPTTPSPTDTPESTPTTTAAPTAAPTASPTPAPSSSPPETEATETEAAGLRAYVLASSEGVVRRVEGSDTLVTEQPARIAYGVDDLVAYETSADAASDGSGATTAEVRVWSPRGDDALVLGGGADSSRLLGAGALEGRPVALVAERLPSPDASRPQEATERLVAVDLRDARRTVYSESSRAFEEGWLSAHLLADGDVVAERFASITFSLVRLDRDEGKVWRTRTVVDRPHAFAAIGERLAVVVNLPTSRAARLRVDTYDTSGSRTSREQVRLDAQGPEPGRCQDWYDRDRLVCAGEEGPVTVSVSGDVAGQAVEQLPGPAGAVVTAVATSG